MARFMQIRAMTPQWAEALYRSKVYTPRDLIARDLPTLQKLFTKARADGMIPDVPNAATIAEMMKEAAEIEFTGAVNGTILDQAGAPVDGADVRIGREHERSDARGRLYRRYPPWASSTLAISHEKYRPTTFRLGGEVDPSFSLRSRKVFIVRRLVAGEAVPTSVLMEARGDVLPLVGDARVGQREVERDALEAGDIFGG